MSCINSKNLLFVTSNVSGKLSPNFSCVRELVKALSALSVCSDVMVIGDKSEIKGACVLNTIAKNKENIFDRYLIKICKMFFMPVGDLLLVHEIRQAVRKMLEEKKYDAVVAVVNPVETAEAIYSLKCEFQKVTFILYEIDPASNRYKNTQNCFQKLWLFKTTKWEKKIYRSFDRIIHMQGHKQHFEQAKYVAFQKKTSFLDIPCYMPEKNFCENIEMHTPVRLLYGGAFYPELRNPTKMFEVLSRLSFQKPLEFTIYTDDRMKNTVKNFAAEYAFVHYEKPLPEPEFILKIFASDVLISLGNKRSDFLPSKIFKYMATGKPIIHFYFDQTDSCLPYFAKYKRALLLNLQNSSEENISKILTFLSLCPSIQLRKEDVFFALKANTPIYTARKIKELIKNE